MLAGLTRRLKSLSLPKFGTGAVLTSALLLAGAGSVQDASAVGDTRTLSFHHTHSREDLTVTFKRNGRYDEEALKKLNYFLRDWRSQDQITMDRTLFDIIWEVYRDVDAKQPIQIISAYRSPGTNAMLRRRSSGVARHSQHTMGHAMDFFIPGVALEKIRFAGLRMQRGGVGFYPTSGSPFVHLDTGRIRHWPRMTPDQLARVFPDGRTVHVPTDGRPLRGYELAMADIQRRGSGSGSDAGSSKPKFLAALFGGKSTDEDDESAAPATTAAASAKPVGKLPDIKVAEVQAVEDKLAVSGAVPMPRAKPATPVQAAAAQTVQVASAGDAVPLPTAKPAVRQAAKSDSSKPQTPADIINARGFWDDIPVAPKQASPAQVAAISARQALEAADPQSPFNALAFASSAAEKPAKPQAQSHPHVVTASAPIPSGMRSASLARHPVVSTKIDTVVGKTAQAKGGLVANSARITAAGSRDSDVWMRAMILMPSAVTTAATAIGDADMTLLSKHFAKPTVTVKMTFCDDPHPDLFADSFSGPAVSAVSTTTFTTAALR
ncbi:DUF882 domain-containing protein [Rhodopseudomonas sp. HC1]|uniref:DUF882 domain-containing protein n=1 Tax=Rhodopseudomonas infernalis TaxID=2897386 RepID=UPI001EE9A1E3|nr:DUF882 domain-containing protein [Rhodopseudomonas infernalis]MCG6204937.1 DUF882 domain-containing protein [Rhodopseudomonas infernalis]